MFSAAIAPVITAIIVVDLQEGVTKATTDIAVSVVPPLIGAVFAGTFLYSLSSDNHD